MVLYTRFISFECMCLGGMLLRIYFLKLGSLSIPIWLIQENLGSSSGSQLIFEKLQQELGQQWNSLPKLIGLYTAVHVNYNSAVTENATQIGLNTKGNLLAHRSGKTGNTRRLSRLYPPTWLRHEDPVGFRSPLWLPPLVFPFVATRWLQVALRG